MNKKTYIGLVVLIVGLCVILTVIKGGNIGAITPNPPPPPPPSGLHPYDQAVLQSAWPQIISLSASPPMGNPKAPYTLVECGDFQCPNCGKAAPLLEKLVADSKGNVKMYFHNFPLPSIHPHAVEAAQAGLSAAAQGKFWQMYHLLYTHQDELIDSEIEYNAKFIPGFDAAKLQSDLSTQKYDSLLRQQSAVLTAVNLQSTPTVFLRKGNGLISVYVGTGGDKPYKGVQALCDAPPWFPPPAHPIVHPTAALQMPQSSEND